MRPDEYLQARKRRHSCPAGWRQYKDTLASQLTAPPGGAPYTPSCTTEGGEGRGVSRSVSGSKRCRPRLVSSSCTSGREAPGAGRWRTSTSYPEKPVIQLQGFGTRWLSPLEPYPFGGPGKHSRHFPIRLRHCYLPEQQRSRIFLSRSSGSPSDAAIDIWSSGGVPRILLVCSF